MSLEPSVLIICISTILLLIAKKRNINKLKNNNQEEITVKVIWAPIINLKIKNIVKTIKSIIIIFFKSNEYEITNER